jgi:hypothetical protein
MKGNGQRIGDITDKKKTLVRSDYMTKRLMEWNSEWMTTICSQRTADMIDISCSQPTVLMNIDNASRHEWPTFYWLVVLHEMLIRLEIELVEATDRDTVLKTEVFELRKEVSLHLAEDIDYAGALELFPF